MPVYDMFSYEIQDDPYPVYRQLLDHFPLYHNEQRKFWALSRYADVQAAFRDWRTFSNSEGVNFDDMRSLTGPEMLDMDPPRHDLLRNIVKDAFAPQTIAALEPRIREHVVQLCEDILGKVTIDLAGGLAKRLPVMMICHVLGLPIKDEFMLKGWSDAILERLPNDDRLPPAALEAADRIRLYFKDILADRRKHPAGDLLSVIVNAKIDGKPLEEAELLGFCFLLFEAGNSTTTSHIANGLLVLSRYPEQRARLAKNPDQLPGAIEELLRFEAPVQNIARVTMRDVEMYGQTIPRGSRVALLMGAANRDERVWENPDQLDVTRVPKRHFAFGEGIHHCIGAPLARLESKIAFEFLLKHIPEYQVVTYERFHDSNQRGLKSLVVRF